MRVESIQKTLNNNYYPSHSVFTITYVHGIVGIVCRVYIFYTIIFFFFAKAAHVDFLRKNIGTG